MTNLMHKLLTHLLQSSTCFKQNLAHPQEVKFFGVGCHCFPPPLNVPTFSARCLHIQRRDRPLAAEGGTLRGQEMFRQISSRIRLPRNSRDLLHAANLRHGTDGFTCPPKKGVLIFSQITFITQKLITVPYRNMA